MEKQRLSNLVLINTEREYANSVVNNDIDRIIHLFEGREGVKWELGFAIFRGCEMGFCALGLRFMKQKQ